MGSICVSHRACLDQSKSTDSDFFGRSLALDGGANARRNASAEGTPIQLAIPIAQSPRTGSIPRLKPLDSADRRWTPPKLVFFPKPGRSENASNGDGAGSISEVSYCSSKVTRSPQFGQSIPCFKSRIGARSCVPQRHKQFRRIKNHPEGLEVEKFAITERIPFQDIPGSRLDRVTFPNVHDKIGVVRKKKEVRVVLLLSSVPQ